MAHITDNELTELEQMVDRVGIAAVLAALSGICDMKEEHIRTYWQDYLLAKKWHLNARKIESLSNRVWFE